MTFYERYEKHCKKQNIPPAGKYAAGLIGCSTANISAIAKSKITPKGDIVAGAAKMLNVSADYLLGLIEYPRQIENEKSEKITDVEMDILEYFRSLNKEGQEIVLAMIKGIAIQDIYKKDYQDRNLDKKKA